MKSKDTFSAYHPVINFLYYALVLVFTMVFMHPFCLAISLVSSVLYMIYLNGRGGRRLTLVYMLPILILAAVSGPLFSHKGNTVLWTFPSGSPLTLESILYGISAAVMLVAVIIWFFSYSEIMTSDKFIYLFGRFMPGLSLVISMTLRFIPKFRDHMKTLSEAQKSLGRDITPPDASGKSKTGLFRRIREVVVILSVMISWSLENAIETADSMNSRGYGLPGRTAFSIYRFEARDKILLTAELVLGGLVCTGWALGVFSFSYFPGIEFKSFAPADTLFWLAYIALCLLPLAVDITEERKWKRLRSEI